MQELNIVEQDKPGLTKRCFQADNIDLFIWQNDQDELDSFKLYYQQYKSKRVLQWSKKIVYQHDYLSSHDNSCISKYSAAENIILPKSYLLDAITKLKHLDKPMLSIVADKIKACPFEQSWCIYMIRANDNSLYTGITTNLHRRVEEHRSGGIKSAKYLRGRNNLKLVFSYEVNSRSLASKYEAYIKKLNKKEKEKLVNGQLCIVDAINA